MEFYVYQLEVQHFVVGSSPDADFSVTINNTTVDVKVIDEMTSNARLCLRERRCTNGFRLFVSPVGSSTFAKEFFDNQLKQVEMAAFSIRHKNYHTYSTQMFYTTTPKNSEMTNDNWNGHLTEGFDRIATTFFKTLLNIPEHETLPTYASLITHLNINVGGLGLIHASTRAVPDFIINMMTSSRCASSGFVINKEVPAINVNELLASQFDPYKNRASE